MTNAACTTCGTILQPGARFCSGCGTPVRSTPTGLPRDPSGAVMRGTTLQDRYKIINFLGEGGFSRVYGAVDLRLRTPCAIKENSEFDNAAHEQFIAEAQMLARLKHSHMTKVTDYFADATGAQFLVMEYVPGKDLERLMGEQTSLIDWPTIAEWGVIACDVLAYLHGQDPPIIHRDIKPANLRLTPDGTLMVIDLGIAKIQKPGTATTRAAQAYSGGYSPIEQYLGQGTDARSDLYALGATLYHLLTGKMPIEAPNRLRGVPQTPLEQARPDLPPLMARAIERAMAMEPEQRPPSAMALQMVFQKVLEQAGSAGDLRAGVPGVVGSQAAQALIGAAQPRTASQPAIGSQPQAGSRTNTQPRSVSQPAIGSQPRTPTHQGLAAAAPSRNGAAQRSAAPLSARIEPAPNSLIWPGDGREMVRVAAGPFPIGSQDHDADELPITEIDLPAFLIDRFPVTCAEYARFADATSHAPPAYWGGPLPPAEIEDHPVVEVTLEDARAYAAWAGKRLPTEAEWEKAASWDAERQHKRVYPWGDSWNTAGANGRDGGAGGTVPVGSYSPTGDSPWGVAEMAGNTWEWTGSAYKRYPYDPGDGRENPTAGGLRATRGGSWSCSPEALRAANRNVAAAGDADFELGFRCAASEE